MKHKDVQLQTGFGDYSAYLDLSDRYGWTLYSFLSERIRNKEMLSSAYEQIMAEFFRECQNIDLEDREEELLLDLADQYCRQFPYEPEMGEKSAGWGFWIALILLVLLNGLCLWIICGILMEMDILPFRDIGYRWLESFLG